MSRQRAPRRADLSQHFLRSRSLAASLIAQAPVAQNDLVVEVGAGRGILTHRPAARPVRSSAAGRLARGPA
ncbi:MAG: hypothetical protein F4Z72_02545 [Gemmatimonadales bacterium]|nr:hypothetical protein [Candidatus Palauibacter irciniicola]MYC19369.1 hypothetical protein [Gemmatimonadales bacterium]